MQQVVCSSLVPSRQYVVPSMLHISKNAYLILPTTYQVLGYYYILLTTFQAITYQITQNSTTLIMSLFNPKKRILLKFCILSTMELQKRYTQLLQKKCPFLCCYIFQLSTHTHNTLVLLSNSTLINWKKLFHHHKAKNLPKMLNPFVSI